MEKIANNKLNVLQFCVWDASAIIPIFVKDGKRSEKALQLYRPDSQHCASLYTKAEVLNGVKKCFFKKGKVTNCEDYAHKIMSVMRYLADFETLGPELKDDCIIEASQIAEEYEIDVIDAVVILTAEHGLFSLFKGGSSEPLLITGDKGLADAARARELKVVNIDEIPD
jgi:predicted nucleic acid-binding protein